MHRFEIKERQAFLATEWVLPSELGESFVRAQPGRCADV
jgi:hypothetical protein